MTRRQGRSSRSDAAAGLTAFALRLTKNLSAADGKGADGGPKNVVFSPLSIYAALALIAAGESGDTLQDLLDALGAGSRGELAAFVRRVAERALADRSRSGGPAIAFACGMWHDAASPPRPGLREAAAASYKAVVRAVDFRKRPAKAVTEINRWVAAATNNLIDSILEPSSLSPDTTMVGTNAIYFNGKWEEPFTETSTIVDKFYGIYGTTTDARFMRSKTKQFIAVHDGYKVLKLPYRSQVQPQQGSSRTGTGNIPQHSMCVFLPDRNDGLPDLVDRISSSLEFRRDHLPNKRVPVGDFRLPKFKVFFSGKMNRVLGEDLGIKDMFRTSNTDVCDTAKGSDTTSMPLFVCDVLHKAVLEVNEEGTVAAAATACVRRSMMSKPGSRSLPRTVNFVADHPFVFFVIEESSGAIVFIGHILDPTL